LHYLTSQRVWEVLNDPDCPPGGNAREEWDWSLSRLSTVQQELLNLSLVFPLLVPWFTLVVQDPSNLTFHTITKTK
jgi:hypothetical protein